MQVTLFVVSESMVIDARSNNVSIFTLLEEIGAPNFPILIPHVTVTAMFAREPNEADATFQMRASIADKVIFETPMAAEFQGRPRSRSILEIGGLAIPGPGVIEFRLLQDGATKESWNVWVNRLGVQQQEFVLTGGPGANTATVATESPGN